MNRKIDDDLRNAGTNMVSCCAGKRSLSNLGVVVFLFLSLNVDVSANLARMLSIRESFDKASTVAVARIDDAEDLYVQGKKCGIRHKATVLERFKGVAQADNRISFGRLDGLTVGQTYLLFLDYDADPKAVLRKAKEEFQQRTGLQDPHDSKGEAEAIEIIKCNGIVPGLNFNYRTAWQVISNYVVIFGLLPENMPLNIGISPTGTPEWHIQKDDLFAYLRTLSKSRSEGERKPNR